MSEERDNQEADTSADQAPEAGAPVVETEPTETEVLAAVDRASDLPAENSTDAAATPVEAAPAEPVVDEPTATTVLESETLMVEETVARPEIALPDELPSAGPAQAAPATGGMLISPDHPMAALYMQTPMPPDIKGNRGAGILIALLASLVFALLYAGVLAVWIAPSFPPSTFLNQGLLPIIFSWGFVLAPAAFFVAFAVLVLILGRTGWWAYVVFGLFVAAAVWVGATIGTAIDTAFGDGQQVSWNPISLVQGFGLTIPVIAAAVVAREVVVWFGAWIGARGRKVTRRNAEAIAEYETALAEAQAKQA